MEWDKIILSLKILVSNLEDFKIKLDMFLVENLSNRDLFYLQNKNFMPPYQLFRKKPTIFLLQETFQGHLGDLWQNMLDMLD